VQKYGTFDKELAASCL